jgi:hypothetical protein
MADAHDGVDASAALARELERVARLHEARHADPALDERLARLGQWQARRLRNTYADLAADPRYAAAVAFFQDDLYSGADFSRRDADLARVVPAMVRMLPATVIATVAHAVELDALSHELDRSLAARLPGRDPMFSVAQYCDAYRNPDDYPRRAHQRALIGSVGAALDRYVRTPMLGTALKMMRQPARLAGFAALQDFLERGFAAFRRMGGAEEFLATIDVRETHLHDAIVAGSNDPFPDPWPASAPAS